ncbi:ArsR/SmtB family transcription factor [Terrisporobacter mayombei]|uniref:Transcriptional repressor SmtB n=1 Tax=Terrisporobacter mayombei TaxID=1541 RepID=A0ABY9Q4Q7_9FIRM|nr:metalloregulator ArsR/SmtB family transcription factor [Terrisporobacter mayombei]MCC3868880.1 metalloregulator ArsR/SmtB family transcription factor [Terrisporobacter mayombei]WMT82985.1 Transcriptional repressor SmtB [Terrisporobacter mayombei]
MSEKIKLCDCNVIHEEVVNYVKEKMPAVEAMNNLTNLFKIMGDSTRMHTLYALVHSEMCVCDLAVVVNVTKSAMSHQLRTLKNAHLIKSRREGKNVFYSLDDEHVKSIIKMAMEHTEE